MTALHWLGLIISLGGGLCFLVVFYPALKALDDPAQRFKVLANALRFYHPLFLFGICLIFVTGAIHLTDLKIRFGTLYYDKIGRILIWKFTVTFLVFIIASMQSFGQGLKFGRMAYGVIPGDLATQERYAKKIWRSQFVNLILLVVGLYLGLKLRGVVG